MRYLRLHQWAKPPTGKCGDDVIDGIGEVSESRFILVHLRLEEVVFHEDLVDTVVELVKGPRMHLGPAL